jgi:hypothetical protein
VGARMGAGWDGMSLPGGTAATRWWGTWLRFALLHFTSLGVLSEGQGAASARGLIISEDDNTDTPLHTCKQSSRSRALLPASTEHVSVARRVHAM